MMMMKKKMMMMMKEEKKRRRIEGRWASAPASCGDAICKMQGERVGRMVLPGKVVDVKVQTNVRTTSTVGGSSPLPK